MYQRGNGGGRVPDRRRRTRRNESGLRNCAIMDQRAVDILESITDEFFALDHQWRYIYINDNLERVVDAVRRLRAGES